MFRGLVGSRSRLFSLSVLVAGLSGCGADEGGAPATLSQPGGAGGGATGGSAGTNAAGGRAGAAGTTSGGAGSTGGAAGLGGQPAGGGGQGGASGGKKPGEPCQADASCTVVGIETEPPACAEAYCKAGVCALRAIDGDGDTFRRRTCKLLSDGAFIVELGGDCDDTKADVSPKGWDGPAADGKPNHCADGIDQDCSGVDGDGVSTSGVSCTCVPGDLDPCAETASGAPIAFPGGTPAKGSRCQLGSRTCVKDPGGKGGQWGPCTNAVGPGIEVCNNQDDDCDGQVDEADAQGKTTWVYDGDEDGYRATVRAAGKPDVIFGTVSACKEPSEVPKECDAAYCGAIPLATCCPPDRWREISTAKGLDCDDRDTQVHPGAAEVCATAGRDVDEDCNGEKNDLPAVGAQVWFLDADGDGVGDAKTPPQTSCLAPGPGWKTNLVNNDCDDALATTRPGIPEDCSTAQDDNCSGSARDGCDCLPTDPQAIDCGVSGHCNFVAGASKCVNGAYEPCPAPVIAEDYCPDLDGDTYCDLPKCGAYCKTVTPDSTAAVRPDKFVLRAVCEAKKSDCNDDTAVISPIGVEACNGADDDCDGTIDDVAGVGDPCNVGGDPDGACLGGGKLACSGSGAAPTCVSENAAIGKPFTKPPANSSTAYDGWSLGPAPNGSADWDCDGKVDLWADADNIFVMQDPRPTCGLTPAEICGSAKTMEQCQSGAYAQTLYYADAGKGAPGCSCLPDACDPASARHLTCGGALLQFQCGWTGKCQVIGDVGTLIVPAPDCFGCSPSSSVQRCH